MGDLEVYKMETWCKDPCVYLEVMIDMGHMGFVSVLVGRVRERGGNCVRGWYEYFAHAGDRVVKYDCGVRSMELPDVLLESQEMVDGNARGEDRAGSRSGL